MIVTGIQLRRFMRYEDAVLDLPDKGVIVVAGKNGQGKSALIEAVSYGLWKKTLRGTSPWRTGEDGQVSVCIKHDFTVRRKCSKTGTVKTDWKNGSPEWRRADTETKTQSELDTHLSGHELWRRTHVFSSSDAAHFSLATDAERKSLIENILGLSIFDLAYEDALKGQRDAAQKLSEARIQIEGLKSLTQARTRNLEIYDQSPEPELDQEPPPEPPTPELPPQAPDIPAWVETVDAPALQQLLSELMQAMRDLQAEIFKPFQAPDLAQAQQAAELALTLANRHLALVRAGKCPECLRAFSEDGAEEAARQAAHDAHEQLTQATHNLTQARALYDATRDAKENQLRRMADQRQSLQNKLQSFEAYSRETATYAQALRAYEARQHARQATYETARRAYETRQASRQAQHARRVQDRLAGRQRLLAEIQDSRAKLLDSIDRAVDLEVNDAVAQQVSKVLGTKGVRAFVLGEALTGLEQVANAWLSRMAPGISIALKAYSENKTGGISDKISLEVSGVGGGYGYHASSGGERRRIDASLLLALAEVSAAARGAGRGTLFLDEVFDAVDSEGVPLVAEAIGELGETRPVVVITHSQDLAKHIQATLRLHVDAGTITRHL